MFVAPCILVSLCPFSIANNDEIASGGGGQRIKDPTINAMQQQLKVFLGEIRDWIDSQGSGIASSQISQPKSRRHNRRREASMKKIESEKCEDSGNKKEFEYEVDKTVVEGEYLVVRRDLICQIEKHVLNEQRENIFRTRCLVKNKEFVNVFPEEIPSGLPLIGGIEHQIYFFRRATIPNNITINKGFDDHLNLLHFVFEVLRKDNLSTNLKKYDFYMDKIVFLDVLVSANGIEVDVEKTKAIKDWPTPKSITKVRSFHALASFYRHFVKDSSTLIAPLTEVIKKFVGFQWYKAQDDVLNKLKDQLCSAPVLTLPDFDKTFEIEWDASGVGIGAVLMQEGKPIAYFSQKLNRAALKFPTYNNELYVLKRALEN
ncbi:Transposon Ty3-G Gag-Pol polyprotein [Senna tora]|uniref:Transposon Ty3-G Gag-Pol polyprotein n=1 Tax=Senna tora TaxID=362788 RepID=A0A834W8H9_9FABA|nr:Transposon Ty3-G Gag-Pol polyprotein [Senna tora]